MEKLSKKTVFLGLIKYAFLPWLTVLLVRYIYHYGFHYVSPDQMFVVDSMIQFPIFVAVYLSRFVKSR
jgi:hypothetical protein